MTDLLVLGAMIGPWQIVLIVVIILLLFGGKKIPDLMRGLGEGIKEFKKATSEKDDDKEDEKPIKEVHK
jgi:sec-independent protein translocase protein TatA